LACALYKEPRHQRDIASAKQAPPFAAFGKILAASLGDHHYSTSDGTKETSHGIAI